MDTASRLQRAISYWQQSWFAGQATAAPTTYYVCDGNVVPDCAGAIVGVRCHPPVVIILVFRHRPGTRSHNRIIWSPVCNARELNHYSYLLGVLLLCSDSNCYAIVHIPCEYWYVDATPCWDCKRSDQGWSCAVNLLETAHMYAISTNDTMKTRRLAVSFFCVVFMWCLCIDCGLEVCVVSEWVCT